MIVTALECRGFRNLADARTALGDSLVIVHGPNGAGKTNLLDAVYFSLTGHSFRSGNDRDLIRFGEDSARVEVELSGASGSTLLAGLDRNGERRHRLDGRPLTGEPGERPLVSVFHPDRLQLVKGPPARRRAHIDQLCAALWPARGDLRPRFGRTLAQRNALVARIRAGLGGRESLPAWDERLASCAEPLIAAREEAIAKLRGPFASAGSNLGLAGAEISYRPRAPAERNQLVAELAARRDRDLDRAYTSYGPQLDDVEIRVGGRALRRFGSQGQQRVALLALLFAERTALLDAGRPPPLMLLDDVMSELDPERRQRLVAALADAGQALITATDPEHVPAARGVVRIAMLRGSTATLAGGQRSGQSIGAADRPETEAA